MAYLICVAIILPFLFALASCTDIVSFRIYNWHNGLILLMFFITSIIAGLTLDHYISSLIAFSVVLVGGMLIFALKWMGGGDVKFAAATAAWFGWTPELGDFFFITMMFGGLFTLALLEFRAYPLPLWAQNYRWIVALHHPKGDVPYGVALAAGALHVLPSTQWFAPLLR